MMLLFNLIKFSCVAKQPRLHHHTRLHICKFKASREYEIKISTSSYQKLYVLYYLLLIKRVCILSLFSLLIGKPNEALDHVNGLG